MKCIGISRVSLMIATLVGFPAALSATSERAAMLQQADPYGFVLTLTAVSVVFVALLLLVVVFKSIGWVLTAYSEKQQQTSVAVTSEPIDSEVAAAIALSLSQEQSALCDEALIAMSLAIQSYIESEQHDYESFQQTIKPRTTQWNNKTFGLRKYPY